MNKFFTPDDKVFAIAERLYKIFFYILCMLILVSSLVKFGGMLDKKVGIGDLKIRLDHLLHASAYFVFSMYYPAGKYLGFNLFKKRSRLVFFIILILLGFLAELLQHLVPYRSFSLMDMLSNLIGIGTGYLVTVLLLRWQMAEGAERRLCHPKL
jgi:VanZ family protein